LILKNGNKNPAGEKSAKWATPHQPGILAEKWARSKINSRAGPKNHLNRSGHFRPKSEWSGPNNSGPCTSLQQCQCTKNNNTMFSKPFCKDLNSKAVEVQY